eukprot:5113826-Alexandrium_andersonii.AAC.2
MEYFHSAAWILRGLPAACSRQRSTSCGAAGHGLSQLHIQTRHWLKLRRGVHSTWTRLRSQ